MARRTMDYSPVMVEHVKQKGPGIFQSIVIFSTVQNLNTIRRNMLLDSNLNVLGFPNAKRAANLYIALKFDNISRSGVYCIPSTNINCMHKTLYIAHRQLIKE